MAKKKTLKTQKSTPTTDKKTKQSKNQQTNQANEDLKNKIALLTEELEETKHIMTKAQHDYINLKMDFDHIQSRMQKQQSDGKLDALLEVVSKFLPFVESLRKSIDNIPDDKKDESLAKGVVMTYNNFLKVLENMSIKQIEAIGLEPDTELHEPVSQAPAPSDDMKGKIIQEFERGFVYQKDDTQKVITTSKVIVGN